MTYLLDTAPLAAYIFGRIGAVARLESLIQSSQAMTSIVNYGEVIEYLRSFPNFAQNEQTLRELLRLAVRPYALTYTIGIRYADLRRTMRTMRGPTGQPIGLIGDIDTLIAATALEHQLTLITEERAKPPSFKRGMQALSHDATPSSWGIDAVIG